MLKALKVFGLSILSFLLYLFIDNSIKINSIIVSIQESESSRGFGLYIAIHLFKWFLLIFSIVSFVVILQKLFYKKQN